VSHGVTVSRMWRALLNGATLYPFPISHRGITGLADWLISNEMTAYASSASIFRTLMRSIGDGVRFPLIRMVWLSSESASANDFRLFQKHFSEDCEFIHTLASSEAGVIAASRWLSTDSAAEGNLPVGPISNGVEVLIQDECGQPLEAGRIGEIVVKSRYLAAGYWRDPVLTAERFSETNDGSGTRLFKTGDLGRITAEGILEFVGRKDRAIKIRGNRVELSEVEDALHRLPGVIHAVVEPISRDNLEDVLVGYVTAHRSDTWSSPGLRSALRDVLPSYMVPSTIVLLDELPLKESGKVDRDALKRIHRDAYQVNPEREPKTATEFALADIWADEFGLPCVGRQDDFFDLGGDSLIAAAIGARIYAILGVELHLGSFFDHPKLADFARSVEEMLRFAVPDDTPRLVRVPRDGAHPLSFFQERIWNFCQTARGCAGYTTANMDRILGPLNYDVLRDCMDYIIGRHETLRTTFEVQGGQPVQVVHPSLRVPLSVIDLTGEADPEIQAKLFFAKEAARIFDLTHMPLFRLSLLRVRDNEHYFIRVFHHIIWDGGSKVVLLRELALLYEAKLRGNKSPLPPSANMQYIDYATWQRKVLHPDAPTYKRAFAWWKNVLSDALPPPPLPFQRPEPLINVAPEEGAIRWNLGVEVSHRLEQLRQTEEATNFMIWLAAFVILLAAETGRRDVLIGTYVESPKRIEVPDMLGLFANLAILKFCCDCEMPFSIWLATVRRTVVDVRAHAEIPYEQLCNSLRQEGVIVPEIRAIFSASRRNAKARFDDLSSSWLDWRTASMPWGFSILRDETETEHACWTTFDAGLYDPTEVRNFIDRFRRLLNVISLQPNLSIARLLALSNVLDRRLPPGSSPICDRAPDAVLDVPTKNL
jgi:hypothetical protein